MREIGDNGLCGTVAVGVLGAGGGVVVVVAGAGVFCVFPFAYSYHEESVGSIKAFHEKMVRRKRGLLFFSTVCFFIALLLLSMSFIGEVG